MNTAFPSKRRNYGKTALLFGAVLLGWGASSAPKAHAFGGEDPIYGTPWHHAEISKEGAEGAGFVPDAAASVAWHADYVDSYLYNPLWWGKGGFNRFKASLSQKNELEHLHFDDLFGTDKVNTMWRRYASGTLVGLVFAAKNNEDVAAAHHVLGASLHAIQDFYSHSNWIDKAERRKVTYFQTPKADRANQPFYTGAYEHEDHEGVKHHGKWLYTAAIFRSPGVDEVMSVACAAVSPLSNDDICKDYKLSKTGQSVRPEIKGVRLPDDVLVMAPQGIAVDNTWVAEIGVKQRGIELTGKEAFDTARELAKQQTIQWLNTVGTAMNKAGYGSFWDKVKGNGSSQSDRELQYEDLNRTTHTFLSWGVYPPTSAAEDYYLRVNIKTANEGNAGTDADIELKANGTTFLLDQMPRKIPGLAVNDFEKGDNDSYVVGPFPSVPSSIELYNNSASNMEVVKAAGRVFVNAVTAIPGKIGGIYTSLTAGQADHIATNKQIWMPEELDQLTQKPFQIDLNGEGEGKYRVHGTITRKSSTETDWIFEVRMDTLECIQESKWDRGSNSDEPFLLSVLSPLPGPIEPLRTEPFDDVDTKETHPINRTFKLVSIPKGYGMLNLAISCMEHDDESSSKRDELLDKFAGQSDEGTKEAQRSFTTAFGAAIAEDWRPASMKITAFSRMGKIRIGTVFDEPINRWIKGKERVTFTLNSSKMEQIGLTDELLPYLPPAGTNTGTVPGNGTPPTAPDTGTEIGGNDSAVDLSLWEGKWATNLGTLTLKKVGNKLTGSTMQMNSVYKTEVENELVEVSPAADGVSVEGRWVMKGSQTVKGPVVWTMAADGNSFEGRYSSEHWTEDQKKWNGEFADWKGTRLTPKPTTGGNTNGTGTGSGGDGNNGNGTTGNGTGGNGATNGGIGGVGGNIGGPIIIGGGFGTLPSFDLKIDKVGFNRAGNALEVFYTLKNPSEQAKRLLAGTLDFILTDADGIGQEDNGNLYAYDGENATVVSAIPSPPKSEIKARYVIDLTPGTAPFKKLTIREGSTSPNPLTIDVSNLTWGNATPAAAPTALSSGTTTFNAATEDWDVRFDGIKAARGGGFEAFVTFKNLSTHPQGLNPYGVVEAKLHDPNLGANKAVGNTYRANGPTPIYWPRRITVEPQGEAKVRFVFKTPTGFKPNKMTIKDTYSETGFEVPINIP